MADEPYKIGIVGLGRIAGVHQQGYRMFDLPVVAGYDPLPEARARFLAGQPGARAYDSLAGLLADPDVTLVDLAAPHHHDARLPAVAQIAAAGKPAFLQKPLAMTYGEAAEIVDLLAGAGVPAMVNQNLCFTPGGLALPPLVLEQRALGQPFLAQLDLRLRFDCPPDNWFGKDERWWTQGHTVHHLALFQMVFGPPERVYAVRGRDPTQPGVVHEGYGQLMLSYRSGLEITVASTGTYYGSHPRPYGSEELWIQGPDGIIDWQPEGGYTLSRRADQDRPDARERREYVATPGRWFPDAFGKAMAHFQAALRAGEEPLCNVADNLYVMAAVEAAYQSAARKQAVTLAEIMGRRYDPDYGPGWWHGYHRWTPPEPAAI
jgi:predicted dehydrogenase